MTSKLTRERVVALIAEHSYDSALVDALEHLLSTMDSEPYGFTDGDRRGMIYEPQYADRLKEPLPVYRHVQQRVVDSEPVAYTDERNLGYIDRGRETAYLWGKQNSEASDVALYRHAQPALVIPNEMTAEQAYEIGYYYGDPVNVFARGANWMRQHIIDSTLAAATQLPCSDPATVPGKWIPVSERMPEDDDFVYIWPRPDFGVELHVGQYCERSHKGGGWYAQVYEQNYGIEWHPITVTHWMPLPAGPQGVKGE